MPLLVLADQVLMAGEPGIEPESSVLEAEIRAAGPLPYVKSELYQVQTDLSSLPVAPFLRLVQIRQ